MLTIENIHNIEGEKISCAFTSQKNWRIMQVNITGEKYIIHLSQIGKVSNWITFYLERTPPSWFDKKYPLRNDRDNEYLTLSMKYLTTPAVFMDRMRTELERF
jgi:hypothetical protein